MKHKEFDLKLAWLIDQLRKERLEPNNERMIGEMEYQIEHLFSAVYQLKVNHSKNNPLCFMERVCLALMFIGKPAKQAAFTLGLSEETLKTYEKRIRSKLKAKNRQESFYQMFFKRYFCMHENYS